ncbi:MAG: class I SAM-dependent methyltransferase [Candidatus Binatia bacterium]
MFPAETKLKGTFYEVQSAATALQVYLDSQKTLYDRVKNQQIAQLLQTIVTDRQHVLEVGCGGGTWTQHFVRRGASVAVVEKERHLVEATRLHLERHNLPLSQVTFQCSDLLDTPLSPLFDFVFAKDVLEHVEDDKHFVERLSSVLVPGGLLLLSTQNSLSLNYVIEGFYQRYLRGRREWMGWDPTHVRFYNYFSLKKLLLAHQLQPLEWVGTYHIPYRLFKIFGPRALSCVETRMGKWFHAPEQLAGHRFPVNLLGWNIVVVAKKISL